MDKDTYELYDPRY